MWLAPIEGLQEGNVSTRKLIFASALGCFLAFAVAACGGSDGSYCVPTTCQAQNKTCGLVSGNCGEWGGERTPN